MPLKYPDILQHNNPALPLIDESELKGGYRTVADLTERNAIPYAKRTVGMIVTWTETGEKITKRYSQASVEDVDWQNEDNWEEFGGGSGGSNLKYVRSNKKLTVKEDYQHFIYGNFRAAGIVNNYGDVTIANGVINVEGDGQVNSLGDGQVNVVNLKLV